MIGFPVGLFVANAAEWLIHKHVLHGKYFGKRRGSYWSFHFFEHHRNSRQHAMIDPDYDERSVLGFNPQGKEALGLVAAAALHAPLLPIAPFYTAAVWYSAARYYVLHKRSHKDPEWAREHLPWHYDHHMGPNPNANWCVSRPWFDRIMGTREPYVGTERERADIERRRRKAAAA